MVCVTFALVYVGPLCYIGLVHIGPLQNGVHWAAGAHWDGVHWAVRSCWSGVHWGLGAIEPHSATQEKWNAASQVLALFAGNSHVQVAFAADHNTRVILKPPPPCC